MFRLYLLVFAIFVFSVRCNNQPNIVIVLTDDQDELLGGIAPMSKTQSLIANKGVTFLNSFVTTPICCPSRASILTGLVQHNHKTLNNSLNGGCSNRNWQLNYEPKTFVTYLQSSGYSTFYAGKYLNQYGKPEVGGASHVPPGWDWWIGLIGNSKYYNYSLSINGSKKHFTDMYLTDVITQYSLQFLKSQLDVKKPFLMILAPPAPHAPFTPEEKYKGKFNGTKAPRTPNFNKSSGKTKHWLARLPPNPLPDEVVNRLDNIQQMRWETLLSVDDLVEAVVNQLDAFSMLNNTYMLFTSDNGYHLGQFGFAWDKRQMYETDIRVPLILRGPNIPSKLARQSPVLNIDIASTVLDMAGISNFESDGSSFLPIANGSEPDNRSRAILIEYTGEGNEFNSVDQECPWFYDKNLSQCSSDAKCKCQDSRNNTYACLRKYDLPQHNYIYCEFSDSEYFRERYDLITDPYQLNNTYASLKRSMKIKLNSRLKKLRKCRGLICHSRK